MQLTANTDDLHNSGDAPGIWARSKADLIMALRLFSRLPTGKSAHVAPDLARIIKIMPVAGVIIGAIPCAVLILGVNGGLPVYFATVLAVAAMVVVGGGMMEDAFADAADGLFGGYTPERRLEIFKDSRHGTYGVATLCLFLLLRVMAIGAVAESNVYLAAGMWLGAHIAGRVGGSWLAVVLPPARADGIAASAGELRAKDFWTAAALNGALLAVLTFGLAGIDGIAAAIVAIGFVVWVFSVMCKRLVGGQTGDLLGAAGALGEIAALTSLLALA